MGLLARLNESGTQRLRGEFQLNRRRLGVSRAEALHMVLFSARCLFILLLWPLGLLAPFLAWLLQRPKV
jgi:hypothetical protein